MNYSPRWRGVSRPAAKAVKAATGGGWVARPEKVLRLDCKGEVKVRVKHKRKTTQAWLAGR